MKAAFLSYNSINGFEAGWQERGEHKALVIPCSHGSSAAPYRRSQAQSDDVTREVNKLWQKLREHISELDLIVVYVGADGSENAIELASELPSEKVIFVLCDCRMATKMHLLDVSGHKDTRRIMCECRGRETMGELCERFLETGTI
jgi:hypothetical protein